MVAPLVAAAGITAGAGLLGGLFDRSSNKRASAAEIARLEAREDSRFQRATVDAKAAGLHPLFALGAAGAGSPSFMAGQSQTGSALGDAVRGVGRVASAQQRSKIPSMTPLQARMAQLQVDNAEVILAGNKLDLVEKQKNLSDNALVKGSAASSQDITLPPATTEAANIRKYDDKIEVVPHKIVTARKDDTSKTAGVKPGWDMVDLHPSLPNFQMPQSDEGWGEDLTIAKALIILGVNGLRMQGLIMSLGVRTAAQATKKLGKLMSARRKRFSKSAGEKARQSRFALEPVPR